MTNIIRIYITNEDKKKPDNCFFILKQIKRLIFFVKFKIFWVVH